MTSRVVAATLAAFSLTSCAGPGTTGPYPGAPWTDPSGGVVAPETLALYSDDCQGRESAGFLDVMWPLDPIPGVEAEMRRYVRDPDSVMPTTELLAPYDRASSLPREARFTGYETDVFQLWVGADDDIYVYLVSGTRVEALPRAADEVVPCP
ncbi:MAG: hypothetical protein WEA76_00780 [Acidimicrobiia bacterium]